MGACAVLVLLYTGATLVSGCTTLIAGRGATVDGSVMATHSDDGESGGDARVVKVPAMDWARGSKRPIYYATEDYPRFVGERGVDAYRPANNPGAAPSVPLGFIEQVNHTFGYYEATYGILNEHQVGIGESTCSAVFGASAIGHGGDALLSVDALSRLTLPSP
jgi:dipeptidase